MSRPRFAAAYGSTIAGKLVVLARDSRPSGSMLRHAVIAGLAELGCTVDDIGIAPTPTCGFAVRQLNAAGGIQITASHNPSPWNGLKMFGPDGAVLSAENGAIGPRTVRGRRLHPCDVGRHRHHARAARRPGRARPGRCSTP